MDQGTRDLLIQKLGTLMVANAELGSVNDMLLQLNQALQSENEALKAANALHMSKPAEPEGAEANGAALGRHEGSGDNLPANPYPEPNGRAH